MPQKAQPGAVPERRYRALVRLAYLVLPGKGKRLYRLAVAQRIVDREFPLLRGQPGGGRHTYARMRTRVLRRAMRPSWTLRAGLGPWLRGLPVRLPDPALTLALAELEPAVRAAYVLREVEQMPRYAVRDQLVELGVQDPAAVLEAAEAAGGIPDARARSADLLEDISVQVACERAARRRARIPVAVATALTIALVGTVFVMETSPSTTRRGTLVKAPPRDWATAPRTLDVWPARGDLANDRAFTERAHAAWIRHDAHTAVPQLLYAGRAGAASRALLRHGEHIVRYTEPGRTVQDVAYGGLLDLGGDHYLLPPWVSQARTPSGDRLAIDDGVVGPVATRTSCRRGPLMWLSDGNNAMMVADLGDPAPAEIRHRSSSGEGFDPVAPGSAGARLWERLGCAERPGPVRAADAWEFWTGKLPQQKGSARWVCTRYSLGDGRTTTRAALIESDGTRHDTGSCDPRRPLSGLWWKSPKKRWYYLAAAAPGSRPLVDGPVEIIRSRERLLVATGPTLKRRPSTRVTLTARDS